MAHFAGLRSCVNLAGVILCWALVSATAQSQAHDGKTPDLTPEQFVSTYSNHRLSSDFILSLYKNLSKGVPLNQATGRPDNWRTVKAADTIRAFPAIHAYQTNQQLVYKFNVSQINRNERLRTVELRLRLSPIRKSHQELHALVVATDAPIYASSIPTATARFAADEVTIMDVTGAVRDWFDNKGRKDLTLDLAFSLVRKRNSPRNKMLRMLQRRAADESAGSLDAILVTYTKAGEFFLPSDPAPTDATKELDVDSPAIFDPDSVTAQDRDLSPARAARGIVINGAEEGEVCHRRDFEIDFLEIGWGEWVVYPTKFNAYQCGGECGGYADSRNSPTNHAIVQSLMRLGVDKAVPMSCCTPTRLSPLNILYLEKGEVVIKHHQEMIVDECGCL